MFHDCPSAGASMIGPFEVVVLGHSISPYIFGKRERDDDEVRVFN
jgi:hypothetical protein